MPQSRRPSGNPHAAQRRPQPRTRWNPKFLAACAGILCLLILIPILIAVASHKDDTLEARRIQMFYSGASGKTSVVYAGKSYEKTITGEVARTLASMDGTREAVLTNDGALYYITPEKLAAVASDVVDFTLSADGSRLGYIVVKNDAESTDGSESSAEETTAAQKTSSRTITEAESTDPTTTEYVPAGGEKFLDYLNSSLFLYNGSDGTAPLIAHHVSPGSVSLSPSGICAAYAVTAESGESFEGYLYKEGTYDSLGRDALPLAVSDDGKNLYYAKYEKMEEDAWVQKLFAKAGEAEIRLAEYADSNLLKIYLNADLSQIVFSTTGKEGSFYFCSEATEKIKLVQGFSPLYAFGVRDVQAGRAVLTPCESFVKQLFIDASGTAQYMDSKHNCINTGACGIFFRVTPDGKTLYYLDDTKALHSCAVRRLNKTDVAADVLNFDISADGKFLYYITSRNTLHCISGSRDEALAEDVYTTGKGLVVTDGGYLYFLQKYSYSGSGTLCYVKGNGSPKVLEDINNVHDIAYDRDNCIYYRAEYGAISGTYDLYYGKARKYTKIFEHMG